MIGNGYCNDETNNAECNFDAGDCCGSCASMEQCSDCQCLDGSPTNYLCKKRIERALLKTLWNSSHLLRNLYYNFDHRFMIEKLILIKTLEYNIMYSSPISTSWHLCI